MPIATYKEFVALADSQAFDVQALLFCAKGVADANVYPLVIDPATGAIPVSFGSPSLSDFGVTTNAPRMASMIGVYDELPTGVAAGTAAGLTGTVFDKSAANDSRALDTHGWLYEPVAGEMVRPLGSPAGNVQVAGLISEDYYGLTVGYPSGTQETYAYYRDAAKTQLICTITVDYTDATKANLSSVVRA